jgi:8-oxo-dGTP pyrophosphatase MutT (NUDIX family)
MSSDPRPTLLSLLARHPAHDEKERRDVDRAMELIGARADCLHRTCFPGHVTGSALIARPDGKGLLFIHHRKLLRWLQPGGHAQPHEHNPLETALREAREETGLQALEAPSAEPIDFDIHVIPARGAEPEHEHLDFRYLFVAPQPDFLQANEEETLGMRWIGWDELLSQRHDAALERAILKARAAL